MNSLTIKAGVKQIVKNLYPVQLMRFAKKTTKPTSGSDVEADKSKKVLRGDSQEDNQPETTQREPTSQSTPQGNFKEVQSVPGHKPPFSEETVGGRYAQTLFIAASQSNNLYNVYNDMTYIIDLYQNSDWFKTFTDNSGLNVNQLNSFSGQIAECGDFCDTTITFLDLLAKNKRYMYIDQVARKYIRAYQMLSKEEKITIISAYELDSQQKNRVKDSLMANPENEGKTFIIDYSVNPSIIGGLQLYSENKFMDLSLNSRVDKLKEEVNKFL